MQKLKYFIINLTLFIVFLSCSKEDEVIDCFPISTVDRVVDLSLPQYQSLNNVGSWVYIEGQLAGTKGLIVVRTNTNSFKVYDRNAPHICPTTNSQLNVVDGIYILCPEDNAKWILTTGQPTAVAGVAPRTYYNSFNSANNTLRITN